MVIKKAPDGFEVLNFMVLPTVIVVFPYHGPNSTQRDAELLTIGVLMAISSIQYVAYPAPWAAFLTTKEIMAFYRQVM